MTGSAARPRPSLGARTRARVELVGAALLGIPRIAMAHQVWNRYAAAGGPLLARGLAFTALFTLVPALLLIDSIAGLAFSEPGSRARIVASLAAQFPPLEEVLRRAVDTALAHAGAFSLISAAVLAWSASGLVRDLDAALALLFGEPGRGRTLLRMVSEVLVVALTVVGLGLIVVIAALPGPLSEVLGLARLRLTAVVTVAGIFALAYRFLPRSRPGWQDAIVPAIWAGIGASLLTGAFTVLGPLLFGAADFYGAFAGIFLGLVWLSYVTQLFLIGAAWVAARADVRAADGATPDSPRI